jgi:Fic-DOC domain mobile mystery protein B
VTALGDPFGADDDATALTAEERIGLVPAYITYRHELNAAEQANIAKAQASLLRKRRQPGPTELIDEAFIKRLHKRMFTDVWRWAGRYRQSDKNLGVQWVQIPIEMRNLCGDGQAWLEHRAYPPDELAVRLHHRLVWIHPFANGNGRLSRMLADLLIVALCGERFTWGSADLAGAGQVRNRYIAALQRADAHVIAPLLAFARS